jgi:arylsulfatase A-like enzyme
VLGRAFAGAAGASLREQDALREPTAWPAEWAQRAIAERHRKPLIPLADPFAPLAGTKLWAELARVSLLASHDQGLVSAALEVEAELHPDLLMILLQGIDRISHFAFGTLEDESAWDPAYLEPAEERPLAREALLDFYVYTDALIGRLLEGYAADDLVIVLSDHGFAAAQQFPRGEHVEGDALDGVIFARGRGIAPGSSAGGASILDIAPTVLAAAGLPAGADMPGRVAAFFDAEPPAAVASYETVPIPRLTRSASGEEAERIEQLRALGYVE